MPHHPFAQGAESESSTYNELHGIWLFVPVVVRLGAQHDCKWVRRWAMDNNNEKNK